MAVWSGSTIHRPAQRFTLRQTSGDPISQLGVHRRASAGATISEIGIGALRPSTKIYEVLKRVWTISGPQPIYTICRRQSVGRTCFPLGAW